MQRIMKPYEVEHLRKQYPPGTRIELERMDNEIDMPVGLKGTVQCIDDAGQLKMRWDNGRSLSLIPNEDRFHVIQDHQKQEKNQHKSIYKYKATMPFTEEQMKQVFDTNLIDFVIQNGFEIEKGDANSVHVKHSGGLYLFKHGRGYKHFSGEAPSGKKCNIITFVQEFMGATDFKSAVEMILGCRAYEQTEHHVLPTEKKPRGELVLPPKADNFDRTISYLIQTRGIDKEIVYAMIKQGRVYQAVTEKNGYTFQNCAFVGFDENNKPKYCALRALTSNSSFRQDVENSDKTYGFCMEGHSNRVYSFEAPIDAMSHATLCKLHDIDWRQDHRVAEGCLSDKALYRYLQHHSEITEIVFCYDNDIDGKLSDGTPRNHGQVQAESSAQAFTDLGYITFIQTPKNKDFNQDLMIYRDLVEEGSMIRGLER